MSKIANIEIIQNNKMRKNKYFVKDYDVTKSVEFLLEKHEREKEIENRFGGYTALLTQQTIYKQKISDLEAKLAEFEKVMEKHDCKSVEKLNGRLYRYDQYEIKFLNMEEEIKELKQQIVELEEHDMIFHNQLAIEQLGKVKELISDKVDENFGDICFYEIKEIFDNQIEQLKKEKK